MRTCVDESDVTVIYDVYTGTSYSPRLEIVSELAARTDTTKYVARGATLF